MFRSVQLWLVLLLLLLGALLSIAFAGLALLEERGQKSMGPVSAAALTIAEVPITLKTLLSAHDKRIYGGGKRFEALPAGWSFGANGTAAPTSLPGYLLLSRYDGDADGATVELVSMADWTVRYRWPLDVDGLLSDVRRTTLIGVTTNWNRHYFRMVHPWVEADGSLVVKDHYSPLIKVDACGQRAWLLSDAMFSHSTEQDADGNLWIPMHPDQPPGSKWPADFHEDLLAKVSTQGQVLWSRSLVDLVRANGLRSFLFDGVSYRKDPLHLNDIQPVLSDGPYWRKGDLFLSLRGPSVIMLYRPSEDRIVWWKMGPWLQQHDVDILDDHRISVFNNNTENFGLGPRVVPSSEVLVYDFVDDSVSSPFQATLADLGVETSSEGLADVMPGGNAMIEEQDSGRIIILDATGTLIGQYINRAANHQVYRLGWTRYLGQDYGDKVLSALGSGCPAP